MSQKHLDAVCSLATCVLFVPVVLLKAFAIEQLWNWFVASYLHLSPVTMERAYGFLILTGLFSTSLPASAKKTPLENLAWLCGQAVSAAVVLVAGWILHTFGGVR